MEPAAGVVEGRSARAGVRHHHEGRRGGQRAMRPARAPRTRSRSSFPPTTRPPVWRRASRASAGIWTSPFRSAPWSRSSTTAAPTALPSSCGGWPRPSRASRRSSSRARAAATRSVRLGQPATLTWWPTWTSTSPRRCPLCSPSSDPCSPATATWRWALAWPGGHESCEGRSASSSHAATATWCGFRCAATSRISNVASKPSGASACPDPASGRRRRMVLRHRADRHGRAARRAHIGDPRRMDRRPDLVGGHRAHGSGRPARDLADGAAAPARTLTRRSRPAPTGRVRPPPISSFPSPGWGC